MATQRQACLERWLPRRQQIYVVELLACPVAIRTWASRMQDRQVILFYDTNATRSAIVKGYTGQLDGSELIARVWLDVAVLCIGLFADRVESASNLADGPSRLEFDQFVSLGSVLAPVNFSWSEKLGSASVYLSWFPTPPVLGAFVGA